MVPPVDSSCDQLLRGNLENCILCETSGRPRLDLLQVRAENFHDYISYESEHFILQVSKGPYNRGHFLILSKQHYDRFADLPKNVLKDYKGLSQVIETHLTSEYGSFMSFEHGSVYEENSSCGLNRAGSCIDHLHVHFLPARIDLESYINRYGSRYRMIDSIEELRGLSPRSREDILGFRQYIYYQGPTGRQSVLDVGPISFRTEDYPDILLEDLDPIIQLPSQLIRLANAIAENRMSHGNWRTSPSTGDGLMTIYNAAGLKGSELLQRQGILDVQTARSLFIANNTRAYYDNNAEDYGLRNLGYDMQSSYRSFVEQLPEGGLILDVGASSGRDLIWFEEQGYEAEGIDSSPKIVSFARAFSEAKIRTQKVQNLNVYEKYDGVWAFASLLHLNDKDLLLALNNIAKATKPGGSIFLSFREGEFFGFDNHGRFFNYMTLKKFQGFLDLIPNLKLKNSRSVLKKKLSVNVKTVVRRSKQKSVFY